MSTDRNIMRCRLNLEPLEERSLLTLMLDPSFTTPGYPDGHVFEVNKGESRRTILQSDNKIIMVGWTGAEHNGNMALMRFLNDGVNDGQLDPTFGNGGKVSISFYDGPQIEPINAVAMQNIGGEERIVIAAHVYPNPLSNKRGIGVMRLHPDGSPDLSFGCPSCNGKVTITFFENGQPMFDGMPWALAIQGDKILVGGTADFVNDPFNLTGRHFAIARLLSNGRLDPTFGTRGRVVLAGHDENEVYGLAITADQKILACGTDVISTNQGSDFAVIRLESNGTLDSDEFATDSPIPGMRFIDFKKGSPYAHDDSAWSLVLQTIANEERIVLAGESGYLQMGDHFRDFALARLHADGQLDLDFGEVNDDGRVITDLAYADIAHSVALQRLGANANKIVITGKAFDQGVLSYFSGARYSEGGVFEESFRSNFPNSGGDQDQSWQIVVQPDDKILAGGFHTQDFGPEIGTFAGFGIIRLCDNCAPMPAQPCPRRSHPLLKNQVLFGHLIRRRH